MGRSRRATAAALARGLSGTHNPPIDQAGAQCRVVAGLGRVSTRSAFGADAVLCGLPKSCRLANVMDGGLRWQDKACGLAAAPEYFATPGLSLALRVEAVATAVAVSTFHEGAVDAVRLWVDSGHRSTRHCVGDGARSGGPGCGMPSKTCLSFTRGPTD